MAELVLAVDDALRELLTSRHRRLADAGELRVPAEPSPRSGTWCRASACH